ncbi:MAG: thiamine pyrophosphate-dependent enzyme [Deltaproteobacteria bacterium]|nr:thiamine pyrophosphate-dependent enzyme [Deltaproteobacteria bacterium]
MIDLVCFRRYGHNETDEPSFTQPMLYRKIDAHPGVRKIYVDGLVMRGVWKESDVEAVTGAVNEELEDAYSRSVDGPRPVKYSTLHGQWSGLRVATAADLLAPVKTAVSRDVIEDIAKRVTEPPPNFTPHRKILRLLEDRLKMGTGELPIDWGMGELLAFGTLCLDGTIVRLSGQDSRRGTFSHRHAALLDATTGETWIPLRHLGTPGTTFYAWDSSLSEAGVLGFEYGYSLESPNTLVLWEAQFGDFANGAQVIIDQFIATGEMKWKRHSGLVLLLPHGYEGQGPEHSSARVVRFLGLAADLNMQIANVTTPAQYFHILRRQIAREFRKPLVLFTPKSLLRHRDAVSTIGEFTDGGFQPILPDPESPAPELVANLIFCSGKVYYDLAAERRRAEINDTAIYRVEQLYPFPAEHVRKILRWHPRARVRWVQEEPMNAGAWNFVRNQFAEALEDRWKIERISRSAAASPATGFVHQHKGRASGPDASRPPCPPGRLSFFILLFGRSPIHFARPRGGRRREPSHRRKRKT